MPTRWKGWWRTACGCCPSILSCSGRTRWNSGLSVGEGGLIPGGKMNRPVPDPRGRKVTGRVAPGLSAATDGSGVARRGGKSGGFPPLASPCKPDPPDRASRARRRNKRACLYFQYFSIYKKQLSLLNEPLGGTGVRRAAGREGVTIWSRDCVSPRCRASAMTTST